MDRENLDFLSRYIGQTVTIFTTSGGCSGDGFTGVLMNVTCDKVTLLVRAGLAPSCPLGSACDECRCNCNNRCDNRCEDDCCGGGRGRGWGYVGSRGRGRDECCEEKHHDSCINPLGAVTIIPVESIAAFTHSAI